MFPQYHLHGRLFYNACGSIMVIKEKNAYMCIMVSIVSICQKFPCFYKGRLPSQRPPCFYPQYLSFLFCIINLHHTFAIHTFQSKYILGIMWVSFSHSAQLRTYDILLYVYIRMLQLYTLAKTDTFSADFHLFCKPNLPPSLQLLGITIRADIPLGLDLLPVFWKNLVGLDLDTIVDLQEADIMTYNGIKKFELVSSMCTWNMHVTRPEI